jgi:hypothetical protein
MGLAPTTRIVNWYKRNAASVLYRRPTHIRPDVPLISFTFDDFPRSALHTGGAILKSRSLNGTYYASLGCLGSDSPSGPLCIAEDLSAALEDGHELGCHTFSHNHSWDTRSSTFEESILQNQAALSSIAPGVLFRSFSYPISFPHPAVKRVCAKHFDCCRGGGQTLNAGTADLNQLSAFFLEKAQGNIEPVKALIDRNHQMRGWIIFATHDVAPEPGPYGCSPEFFEQVVQCAVDSGARVLPVAEALNVVCGLQGSVSGSYGTGAAAPVRPEGPAGPASE